MINQNIIFSKSQNFTIPSQNILNVSIIFASCWCFYLCRNGGESCL